MNKNIHEDFQICISVPLTEEAIIFIARSEKRKKKALCEMLKSSAFFPLLSWKLKRGRSTAPMSFKFKLFC